MDRPEGDVEARHAVTVCLKATCRELEVGVADPVRLRRGQVQEATERRDRVEHIKPRMRQERREAKQVHLLREDKTMSSGLSKKTE
ncbi:MAG: hypothetical protein WED04_07980 [Promethearchaeati archaeon SRVP18_Atabeyarchaeia-1]